MTDNLQNSTSTTNDQQATNEVKNEQNNSPVRTVKLPKFRNPFKKKDEEVKQENISESSESSENLRQNSSSTATENFKPSEKIAPNPTYQNVAATQNSQPSYNASSNKTMKVEVKPLRGFLIAYILFSIPGIIAGILWIIVLFALLGSILGGTRSNSETENNLSFAAIQSSSNREGVLIYDLSGPITSGGKTLPDSSRTGGVFTDIVAKDFKKIKEDTNIKNVVFRINTPGGEVFASKVLGDQIVDLIKAKNQTQAVFYFDQVVASGGLWAAYKSPNNYVVASDYGETGSIGVRLSIPNLSGLADKVGYKETVLKSSQSKDIGSPLRDPSSEETSFLQSQINDEYQQFIDVVAQGRKLSPEKVKEFANGYVYPNNQAKTYGLVDELGTIERATQRAAQNANLGDNYNVWEIENKLGTFQELFGTSNVSSLIGLPQAAINKLESATALKSGTMYAIDDTKI